MCGLISGNYDIHYIFIDAILRICGRDMDEFSHFLTELNAFSERNNVNFTLTVSCTRDQIPAEALEVTKDLIVLA